MNQQMEDDLQEIESLLSSYRSALYNLTCQGAREIERDTEHFADAIHRIRMANDSHEPLPNYLNGMKIIARTKEAVYLRIPEALQVPSAFAGGHCTCGHCDGSGKWDTLLMPLQTPDWNRVHDFATTVHMPDGAIQPFLDATIKLYRSGH